MALFPFERHWQAVGQFVKLNPQILVLDVLPAVG